MATYFDLDSLLLSCQVKEAAYKLRQEAVLAILLVCYAFFALYEISFQVKEAWKVIHNQL
jgi:hypothetical protein